MEKETAFIIKFIIDKTDVMYMQLSIEVFDSILLFGTLLGLALSIIIFVKQPLHNRYLGMIIIVLTYSSFGSLLWYTNSIQGFPHLLGTSLPTLFLVGPCYYLYVLSIFGKKINLLTILKHVMPFIVCLLLLLPFYILSEESKLTYIDLTTSEVVFKLSLKKGLYYGFLLIHLCCYLFVTMRFITALPNIGNRQFVFWKQWVRILSVGLFALTGSYFFTYVIYTFTDIEVGPYRDRLFAIIALFMYCLAFVMIYKSNLLGKSSLRESNQSIPSRQLLYRLKNFIELDKPYLNPELRLNSVASQVKISPQKLSAIINTNYGKTFSDFLNEYRVEEAKRLLMDPDYLIYDLEGIAKLAGFNSRTNLTRVFKKLTHQSPTGFKKNRIEAAKDSALK